METGKNPQLILLNPNDCIGPNFAAVSGGMHEIMEPKVKSGSLEVHRT